MTLLGQVLRDRPDGALVRPLVAPVVSRGRFTDWGRTQPTTSNTGTLPGVARTTVSGSTINVNAAYVTANGGRDGFGIFHVDNKTFTGRVVLSVANVKFTNCQFNSPPAFVTKSGSTITGGSYTQWMVDCENSACAGIEFWDCYFEPDHAFPGYAGCVGGHGFTMYRCWLEGGIDGVDPFNAHIGGDGIYHVNVAMYGCWSNNRDYYFNASNPQLTDPQHPDGSHCDDIQPSGGDNIHIEGCVFNGMCSATGNNETGYYPTANSAIQFNDNSDELTNITIINNWFGGGVVAPVNGGSANSSSGLGMSNTTITGNRFFMNGLKRTMTSPLHSSRNDWSINLAAVTYNNSTVTVSGNTSLNASIPFKYNNAG